MGRTDIRALEVPDPPLQSAAQFGLTDPLGGPAATRPAGPGAQAEPAAAAATPKLEATSCPHCAARVSPLEAKFGRCVGCGRSLDGAQAKVSIGI